MKKYFYYALIISICSLGFYACSEDDDDPVSPQNNAPAPGTGGGAGTGGGTGSGGIPPNSMKVTVDGNVIDFDTVNGSLISSQIVITGSTFTASPPNFSFPELQIEIPDTLSADTFFSLNIAGFPSINYIPDSVKFYQAISGYLAIRKLDTARNLVNGRFEVIMVEDNDPTDSLVLTKGQFNKFYN